VQVGSSLVATIGLLLSLAAPAQPATQSPLAGWAVVVVAGDDQGAHDGRPTRAFDNARRDVATALERRGFSAGELAQFSLHPDLYPADHAARSDLGPIATRLRALASQAPGGCLVYVTSHGSPDGIVVDNRIVPPPTMRRMIAGACGSRPTAVILSACFSGVFLPALAAPNRFVFTAARRDRSSFGCGESDRYPFFDACVIEGLPGARDFIDLADQVKRCVAAREDSEGMRPRSQPQLYVGPAFRAAQPPFAAPAG
jgi:Peptidase C13 family